MQKLMIISVGLLLIGVGCAGKKQLSQSSGLPSGVRPRVVVDCAVFGKKTVAVNVPESLRDLIAETKMTYVAKSRGSLSKNFVDIDVAPQSELCGSVVEFNASYYITKLSDEDLYAYFKKALAERNCAPEEVAKADPRVSEYLTYLPFACPEGKGLVFPYVNMLAYGIIFNPMDKN